MLLLQCLFVWTFMDGTSATIQADIDTLLFVHVLWRHGARTPGGITHSEEKNQLTREGARQQYELGQWLRRRYDGFLSKQYKPHEIYVRSSDFDRTLMSAEWNMAGLYPVNDSVIEGLPWQAIPVHTMQTQHDSVMMDNVGTPCPAIAEYGHTLSSSSEYTHLVEEFENLLGVSLHNPKFLEFFSALQTIVEPYLLSESKIATTPSWMSENNMKKYRFLTSKYLKMFFYTPLMKRLRGGPITYEILNRFQQSNTSQENRLKFYAYSGHDFSILSLLSTFDIVFPELAEPSSVVLLEMHARNGIREIELFYKPCADCEVDRIAFPNCPDPCSLDDLRTSVQQNIPHDWNNECQIADLRETGSLLSWSIFGVAAICAIAIIMKCFLRKKEETSSLLTAALFR